jgi:hypothetical protein
MKAVRYEAPGSFEIADLEITLSRNSRLDFSPNMRLDRSNARLGSI